MRSTIFFERGDMAKSTAGKTPKSSRKASKTSFRAIKKHAKKMVGAEKAATKRVAPSPTSSLTGREARSQERFRELVAWYMLQGVDEATARRRAQDEIDDDLRKD
jgi:hypothetical protein